MQKSLPCSVPMEQLLMKGFIFNRSHRLPVLLQADSGECGLICVAMIANYFGLAVNPSWIRQNHPFSARGANLNSIVALARNFKMNSRVVSIEKSELPQLSLPALLHWDMDHFVVLKKVGNRGFVIHDPAVGLRKYSLDEIGVHLTGIAVELWPCSDFAKQDSGNRLRLNNLFRLNFSFMVFIGVVVLLSLFIQAAALLMPFYLQLALDQGIGLENPGNARILALVFAILVLGKAALGYLRGQIVIGFSNRMGFQLVADLYLHMLALPLAFFEARPVGDILSRFNSIDNIRQLVTQEAVAVIVDGVLSASSLILLYVYSPVLASISLVFIILYLILRSGIAIVEKDRRQAHLQVEAKQKSEFLDDIRSITSTRLNNMVQSRAQQWLSSYANFVNSNIVLGKFQLGAQALKNMITGIDHVVTVYLGIGMIAQNTLSTGQLMAFIFLKQHLTASLSAMIPRLVEMKMIKLDLDRLADIATVDAHAEAEQSNLHEFKALRSIEAIDLSYTYPGASQPTLEKICFSIGRQQSVLVTGESGSGKTTLLRMIAGINSPSSGKLTFSGMSLDQFGPANLLKQMSVVLGSTELYKGSIYYNIVMSDEAPDSAWLKRVCALVQIDQDIERLPMTFNTLVTSEGSGLSTGQIQRLMLARALYRRPRFLLLDEALTGIDRKMALNIVRSILEMKITLIFTTHDPGLMQLATQHIKVGRITA